MFQIKHYETLETFNNDKSNLETPWVAYVEENSTVYYSVDDITKYRAFLVRQKDISNMTYEAVDLGLPSGLKWADRNVGASSPEDFGSYFQWGDTHAYTFDGKGEVTAAKMASLLQPLVGDEMEVTKDNVGDVLLMLFEGYDVGTDLTNTPMGALGVSLDKFFDWNSYFDTTDSGSTFNKYNNSESGLKVLESSDDAAYIHTNHQYRMPTIDEILELINNTTQTFIDLDGNEYSKEQAQNGVIEYGKLRGVRFIGSNGNNIFIPAAGDCYESLLLGVGMNGGLWSSSLNVGDGDFARGSYFYYDDGVHESINYRYYGRSVRGVLKQ